jgi:tRNA pseudouridine(38-40) synthase
MCDAVWADCSQGLQAYTGISNTIEAALAPLLLVQVDGGTQSGQQCEMSFQRAVQTPRGVHALANILSVKLPKLKPSSTPAPQTAPSDTTADPAGRAAVNEWLARVNSQLPADVRVLDRSPVGESFHADKSLDRRRYEYLVPYAAVADAALDGDRDSATLAEPSGRTGRMDPNETTWHRNIQVREKRSNLIGLFSRF